MTLSPAEVTRRADPRHWRVVLGHLETVLRTGDFATGVELLRRVGAEADRLDHHPDVDLRYGTVHLRLVSHDVRGLTERDLALAAAVSAIADELGLEADPARPRALEVAVDALDIPAVVPFWRAVLGYVEHPDDPEVLVDPEGVGPVVWFQQMDAPRPQRNRLHLDVNVPHDVAEDRVRAAVAAGGHVVSDRRARAFWVLADAEGNEVCVCTWQDRD